MSDSTNKIRHLASDSTSTTTSNLIRNSKEIDTLGNMEQVAEKDKERLTSMLDDLDKSAGLEDTTNALLATTSTDTNSEDYADADEYIANRLRADKPLAEGETSENAVGMSQTTIDDRTLEEVPCFDKVTPPEKGNDASSCPQDKEEAPKFHTPTQEFGFETLTYQTKYGHEGFTNAGIRRSVISDYSPSIHEVNPNQVVYVVDSKKKNSGDNGTNLVSTEGKVSRNPSIVKVIASKNAVSSDATISSDLTEQESKIRSAQSIPLHRKKKALGPELLTNQSLNFSTIGDSNDQENVSLLQNKEFTTPETTGSETSPLRSSRLKEVARLNRNDSLRSTDTFDFKDGDDLITKHSISKKNKPADLNYDVSYDDIPIPSRSPRRPISGICTGEGIPLIGGFSASPGSNIKEDLLKFKGHTKSKSFDVKNLQGASVIHNLIGEIDDEIISVDEDEQIKQYKVDEILRNQGNAGKNVDQRHISIHSLNPRPLPPPPVPQHTIVPSGSSGGTNADVANAKDDGFVTEEEEEEEAQTQRVTSKAARSGRSKKKRIHSKRKSISSNFDKGQFNHETLVQMLQLSNGTIVGQEFQQLEMETKDKQLLERLVDSLSRLTADMIIDEDRHDESVRRLNKAIKALEGF